MIKKTDPFPEKDLGPIVKPNGIIVGLCFIDRFDENGKIVKQPILIGFSPDEEKIIRNALAETDPEMILNPNRWIWDLLKKNKT
jgi:hypothetical protein